MLKNGVDQLYVRFIILLCLFSAWSCRQGPDLGSRREEILALHRSFIDAHLAEDASSLAEAISESYLFVADGEIVNMVPEDVERNLQEYFDATTFSVYRDLSEPIIGLSADGSLAWSIVNVRVAGTRSDEPDLSEPFDTQWAWITLYERRGDRWVRTADVSTNKEFKDDP